LQKISFGIGLVVAIGLNVDTIALTTSLYRDKDARDATVAIAVQVTEKTDKETFDKCLSLSYQQRKEDASCAQLNGLVDAVQGRNEFLGRLPIGWPLPETRTRSAESVWGYLCLGAPRIVGWLLTALALSLGAPFWFDLLNNLVNMRHGMRRPEVKEEKKPNY
jgi:hypothetical protein